MILLIGKQQKGESRPRYLPGWEGTLMCTLSPLGYPLRTRPSGTETSSEPPAPGDPQAGRFSGRVLPARVFEGRMVPLLDWLNAPLNEVPDHGHAGQPAHNLDGLQ